MLEEESTKLTDPLDKYPPKPRKEARELFSPKDAMKDLEDAYKTVEKKYPKADQKATALQTLIRLSENLKYIERAEESFRRANLLRKRADQLLVTFEKSRDEVLEELYNTIQSRFAEFYRELHSSDEDGFDAEFRLEKGKLNFEVEFYGRGKFPPIALHSEGHQDSMGLCLYLALSEYLAGDTIQLTILDDVVMSVDGEHRRHVCGLLSKKFPERQFLITTHDRTWASQLRTEGIVGSSNSFEFGRWSLATGPIVSTEVDLWEKIDEALSKNEVPDAAFRLRRGSEHFFEQVCNNLSALIRYRSDYRWDFSQYIVAGVGRLNELLKVAKNAAHSWGTTSCFCRFRKTKPS